MQETSKRNYRYYDLVMAAFVTVLLCSNLIGVHKVTTINLPFAIPVWFPTEGWFTAKTFTFGAGVLFFPISYVFGDILTEVYGYARSRKVIWAGFGAMIFASFMSWVVARLPPSTGMNPQQQQAIEMIFGQTPRIVLASLTAFWMGEFANSFVLAKMKIFSEGRRLWQRTIGSTIVGEAVDSMVFYPIAFLGTWETSLVINVMISNYFLKVMWEVFATPVTYRVVNFLKRAEHEDYYDRDTNFNPFTLQT
jgi:uncharacterized integral membrane protein (TIGR00697 family)